MKKHNYKIITLGILTAIATGVIYVINRMIATASILKDMLHSNSSQYYKWRFGNIYYHKKGKGAPLLLIHDLVPGSSAYEWSKIENELAQKYTVYSIDLLGCGRSDKPAITYTNFLYVQLITDFIKNVIKKQSTVIASGYSASFAVMACHHEKEYFNKLVLINPPSLGVLNQIPNRRSKLLKSVIEIPVFGTLIYNMITSAENINNAFIENYFYNPFHVSSDIKDAYYESAHRNDNAGKFLYASKAGRFTNINICHALEAIDHSIVLLTGEHEKNASEIQESYINSNPSIETASIKSSCHFPHMEEPEEFLQQISIYLS